MRITLLETSSVLLFVRPPFTICKVNCVDGFKTEKLSVTVTGAPVPRVYVLGPNAFQVPAQSGADTVASTERNPRMRLARWLGMGCTASTPFPSCFRAREIPKGFVTR